MQTTSDQSKQPVNKPTKTNPELSKKAYLLALEFGLIIAIPLAVFGSLGKWLATQQNNRIFLFAGLILALLISTGLLFKKINDIYKDFIK